MALLTSSLHPTYIQTVNNLIRTTDFVKTINAIIIVFLLFLHMHEPSLLLWYTSEAQDQLDKYFRWIKSKIGACSMAVKQRNGSANDCQLKLFCNQCWPNSTSLPAMKGHLKNVFKKKTHSHCWCAKNSANNELWDEFQKRTHPFPPHETRLAPPPAEFPRRASRKISFTTAQPNSFLKETVIREAPRLFYSARQLQMHYRYLQLEKSFIIFDRTQAHSYNFAFNEILQVSFFPATGNENTDNINYLLESFKINKILNRNRIHEQNSLEIAHILWMRTTQHQEPYLLLIAVQAYFWHGTRSPWGCHLW